MSRLTIEYHQDHRTMTRVLVLKDDGLGRVVVDQLPEWGPYVAMHDLLADIKHNLKAMYFYCAPRTTTKAITMTWEQALQTSQFLKETI